MNNAGRSRGSSGHRLIGCCGAYCKTCRSYVLGSCRGCKLGYEEGERDMARARCRIKRCCFGLKHFETCAECPSFDDCVVLSGFYGKGAKEYPGYRRSLEFIRANGYCEFIRRAKGWRRAYGELQD